ncbi:MAG: serine protease [Alphaproteobacteria bacterium]|nr:serine protease [Alphaproteobacteria bacterium]
MSPFAARRQPLRQPAAAFAAALLAACLLLPASRAQAESDSPPPPLAGMAAAAQTPPVPAVMDDEAQRIYRKYGDALYQIQVIDVVTEKKTAIGSGFQFTKDGMIATNYHVVADAIQRPDANRLEFVHDRFGTGRLKILTADVRYDLAILQLETPNDAYVELGKSDLPKGTRLFSLGNPHDIGFTIVEGTYNGVSRDSFIDKIHFSGAVNPGMSGGPVLGHDGRVAGINVMTAGNQIGFLVPVEPLRDMVAALQETPADTSDFAAAAKARIGAQLTEAQTKALGRMQDGNWNSVPFGRMTVPGRIDTAFKCWASQRHTEKSPYTHHRTSCSTEDSIYLDEGFTTGSFSYSYDLLRARKGFGSLRFYNIYEQLYATPADSFFSMNAQEKDVSNFDCETRFVVIDGQRWKASFCARHYKEYAGLHDMLLYMAQLGQSREGLVITLGAQGVTKDGGLSLIRRFMSALKPQPTAAEEPPPPLPAAETPPQTASDKSGGAAP